MTAPARRPAATYKFVRTPAICGRRARFFPKMFGLGRGGGLCYEYAERAVPFRVARQEL